MKFLTSLVLIISFTAKSQSFHNLDFAQTCDSSKTGLCYWDLSWGGKNTCMPEIYQKDHCLLIENKSLNAVGFAEQSAIVAPTKELQVLQLSARINSENVEGKGAGLNISIYDADNNLLFTKDMGYASFNWIHGTTTWKDYHISAICPEGTAKITIGAILYGKGKARFDDYKITLLPVKNRRPSQLAIKYISAACDTIKKHSLVKDSVNINAMKRTALQIAGPAKTYADCHLAVDYLIASLRNFGDYHSSFMTPEEVKGWQNNSSSSANVHYPTAKIIDGCGYILVPPFHAGSKKLMSIYVDTLQSILNRLDNTGIKGWIIDLRENTGGNQEPMITGLGPLFDTGKLGSLVDVYGKRESWYYKAGTYYWENEKGMKASHPVSLSSHLPIAVLTGQQTGSSGEIVVISFIGNSNTRSFGQPTWGLTTGNGSFDLVDSGRMMLASTIMADKNEKMYRSSIVPDQQIPPNNKPGEDETIRAAIDWIKNKK